MLAGVNDSVAACARARSAARPTRLQGEPASRTTRPGCTTARRARRSRRSRTVLHRARSSADRAPDARPRHRRGVRAAGRDQRLAEPAGLADVAAVGQSAPVRPVGAHDEEVVRAVRRPGVRDLRAVGRPGGGELRRPGGKRMIVRRAPPAGSIVSSRSTPLSGTETSRRRPSGDQASAQPSASRRTLPPVAGISYVKPSRLPKVIVLVPGRTFALEFAGIATSALPARAVGREHGQPAAAVDSEPRVARPPVAGIAAGCDLARAGPVGVHDADAAGLPALRAPAELDALAVVRDDRRPHGVRQMRERAGGREQRAVRCSRRARRRASWRRGRSASRAAR